MQSYGYTKMPFTLGVLIIVLSMHCTDVKVSVIKISEIFFLLYAVHLIGTRLSDSSRFFMRFFSVFLLITFIHNLSFDFKYSFADNILKQPYWCSIGRYLEVVSCISFLEFTRRIIDEYGFEDTLNRILRINFLFSLFIVFLYIAQLYGNTLIPVSYSGGRMKGLFVEGGPFGLLCAAMGLLSIYMKRPIVESALLICLVLLARSKAGIACLCAYFAFNMILKWYLNERTRRYVIVALAIIIPGFIYVFTIIAEMYISTIMDTQALDLYVNTHPYDYSATAGRIPATFILYNMFLINPLIGIGIGNYPLLRNLQEYRAFFPTVDLFDAPGYGGLVDIFNQCGIIGFSIVAIYFYKQFKIVNEKIFLMLFILPLTFGVQYTFMYPWFMLALHEYSINLAEEE